MAIPEMNTEKKPMRVFLIDDHEVLRAGVHLLIESDSEMEIVGEAGSYKTALSAVKSLQPDVILLDLDLGGGPTGFDLLPQLLSASPASRVIILTGILDEQEHQRAMRAGASGLVLKRNAVKEVAKAIRKVYEGELWFDQTLIKKLWEESSRRTQEDSEAVSIASLSSREREVIRLLGRGLRNKQIGERLFISEGTVRQHLTSVFAKLNVSDRFELIMYAYRHSLAEPPL